MKKRKKKKTLNYLTTNAWQWSCLFYRIICTCAVYVPLPSNRHHRSNGDCLEGKRENYQVCFVQHCVQQLCTVRCTHIWTDLKVLWIGFCFTGRISLCLDSFLYVHVLCVLLYIACMCRFVTWSGGPGDWSLSLGLLLLSVLWHCRLGRLTRKNPTPIWPIMCLVGS